MKTQRIILFCFLLPVSWVVFAQTPNYSARIQRLVPETNFLPQADWEAIFFDPTQKDIATKVGIKKRVVIALDESVFINNRYAYNITKVNSQGKVVRTFGKKGSNPGEFINNPDLHGILNNKYVVTSDAQGRINFFDLDGNFIKMITIDFMPLKIFPVGNGKLIIQGHVPYGTKSKNLIAELDFETEKYHQIYYTFQDYDDPKGGVRIHTKDGIISTGPAFSTNKIYCRVTSSGQIVLGVNDSDQIQVFTNKNGTYKESEFTLKTNPIPITKEEKEEYYRNFKERLNKLEIDTTEADKILREGYFPRYLPNYYNIVLDDANNCLFFIYSNDGQDHLFRAYTIDGKYLGESEFTIEGYDLLSGLGHFYFMNGYVYTLALKKGADSPMRILKCKIISE
ncbi:MAG: hypothetical protein KQI35_11480 [Bacteroidetes bacterium]|nr:hypothetical protein [Bacteroidota bacterium]